MAVVTMKQLLDSGTHFGHQTRRWNPKMKRFIFTDRNGIYIIDLQQTLTFIDKAYEFVKETVAHGGSVLFVGTKKQAQESVAAEATRVGMPYVNQRWLGGMLTNFSTVHKRLQRLKELEAMEQTGGFEGRTKKEILMLTREKNKLDRSLGGIRDMAKVPSAIWVVDTNKEHIAVGEARKLGIPVIAILDTNCDPDEVDYPIPGNDDAIRSAALLTKVIASAVAEGLQARAGVGRADGKPEAGDSLAAEPLAEWEQELLASATTVSSPGRTSGRGRSRINHRSLIGRLSIGEFHRCRRQATSGADRCRHARLQERAGRKRRRLRQGRRGAADQGRQGRRQARRAGDGRGPGRGQGRRADRAEQRDRLRRQERRVPEAGRRDRCGGGRIQGRRRRRAEGRRQAGDKTVEQAIAELSAKIGEKLELRRVAFFDGTVETYLHKRAADLPPAVGVLVEYGPGRPGQHEAAHAVALQIAALKARYLSRDDVPEDVVASERRIAEETAKAEGKPEQALPKIVEGRLNGFFKDAVLLEQPSVSDNKKTVKALLDEAGVTVTRFVRFEVGQA